MLRSRFFSTFILSVVLLCSFTTTARSDDEWETERQRLVDQTLQTLQQQQNATGSQVVTFDTRNGCLQGTYAIKENAEEKPFILKLKKGIKMVCPRDMLSSLNNNYWSEEAAIQANITWGTDSTRDDKIALEYAPCKNLAIKNADGSISCDAAGVEAGDRFFLGNAECKKYSGIEFCGERRGNMICAYIPSGVGIIDIGCMGTKNTSQLASANLACFMPKLCNDESAWKATKSFFSVSGTIVQCVETTLKALFLGEHPSMNPALSHGNEGDNRVVFNTPAGGGPDCPAVSMFDKVKNMMKSIAIAALILYIVAWGLKVATSGQLGTRGDFIMRVITFALVSYFAIGDGWKDYYPHLMNITNGLSQAMVDAVTFGQHNGERTGYCVFDPQTYPAGYEHMALWDTLDCKMLSYILSNGVNGEQYAPKLLVVGLFSLLTNFSGILILIFCGVLLGYFIGMMVTAVEIYIMSMIGVAILVFVSPLFIPMILFPYTKKYFEAWRKELMSLTLYPVVMIAAMMIVLTSFDVFYYGDPQKNVFTGEPKLAFQMGGDQPICDTESFGCQLYRADFDPWWDKNKGIPGIGWFTIDNFDYNVVLLALVKICLLGYLWFMFVQNIGAFMADLLGSQRLDPSNIKDALSSAAGNGSTNAVDRGRKIMGAFPDKVANASKTSAKYVVGRIGTKTDKPDKPGGGSGTGTGGTGGSGSGGGAAPTKGGAGTGNAANATSGGNTAGKTPPPVPPFPDHLKAKNNGKVPPPVPPFPDHLKAKRNSADTPVQPPKQMPYIPDDPMKMAKEKKDKAREAFKKHQEEREGAKFGPRNQKPVVPPRGDRPQVGAKEDDKDKPKDPSSPPPLPQKSDAVKNQAPFDNSPEATAARRERMEKLKHGLSNVKRNPTGNGTPPKDSDD